MKYPEVLKFAFHVCEKVDESMENGIYAGERRKSGFNFFSGLIANSTHLEKYHTNFISYLLSSKDHGFEHQFLAYFIKMLKEKLKIKPDDYKQGLIQSFEDQVHKRLRIEVTRERTTFNGRVDIEVQFHLLNGILFIENKIRSSEGKNQMLDYFVHYSRHYPQTYLGIFLTKNGDWPESIDRASEYTKCLVTLSYKDIIRWLDICCKNINNPVITGCLSQYIQIVKKELNIMENAVPTEMITFLKENAESLSSLVKNRQAIESAVQTVVKEYRNKFLDDLRNKIGQTLNSKEYALQKEDSGRFQCTLPNNLSFKLYIDQAYPATDEGGKGLWWGIYDPNGRPFKKNLRLQHNCWESIIIDGIDDFMYDDEGAEKIIRSTLDMAMRSNLIEQIATCIGNRIDTHVLPVIKKQSMD